MKDAGCDEEDSTPTELPMTWKFLRSIQTPKLEGKLRLQSFPLMQQVLYSY